MKDTPTSPDSGSGPHGLDLSVLSRMVGDDSVKFEKFARLFMSSMEDVLRQVDAAIAAADMSALAAMGHRAKSTALNVGATALSGRCVEMEQAAKAGLQDDALQIASSLRLEYDLVCQAMHARLS